MTSSAQGSQTNVPPDARAGGEKVGGPDREIEQLRTELEQTRAALAAAERELFELRRRRSATMAELQRKAYWLERAQIDPDAWMRRRPVALGFKAFQRIRRLGWRLSNRAR
jgi:chromosome segregation ATPase